MDSNWQEINVDLLRRLLHFAGYPETVGKCSLTCKRWSNEILTADDLWRNFERYIQGLFTSPDSQTAQKTRPSGAEIISLFQRFGVLKQRIKSFSPNVDCLFSKYEAQENKPSDEENPDSASDDDAQDSIDENNLYGFDIHYNRDCAAFITHRTVKSYDAGWSTQHDVSHLRGISNTAEPICRISGIDKFEYAIEKPLLVADKYLIHQPHTVVGSAVLKYQDILSGENHELQLRSIFPDCDAVSGAPNQGNLPWVVFQSYGDQRQFAVYDLESQGLVLEPQTLEALSDGFGEVTLWNECVFVAGEHSIHCFTLVRNLDDAWSIRFEAQLQYPADLSDPIVECNSQFVAMVSKSSKKSRLISLFDRRTGTLLTSLAVQGSIQSVKIRHRLAVVTEAKRVRVYDLMAPNNDSPIAEIPTAMDEWKEIVLLDADRWLAVRDEDLLFLDFSKPRSNPQSTLTCCFIGKPLIGSNGAVDARCVNVAIPLSSEVDLIDFLCEILKFQKHDLKFDAYSFYNIRTIVLSRDGSQSIDFSQGSLFIVAPSSDDPHGSTQRATCFLPASFSTTPLVHVDRFHELQWNQGSPLGTPPPPAIPLERFLAEMNHAESEPCQWDAAYLTIMSSHRLAPSFPNQAQPYLCSRAKTNGMN